MVGLNVNELSSEWPRITRATVETNDKMVLASLLLKDSWELGQLLTHLLRILFGIAVIVVVYVVVTRSARKGRSMKSRQHQPKVPKRPRDEARKNRARHGDGKSR